MHLWDSPRTINRAADLRTGTSRPVSQDKAVIGRRQRNRFSNVVRPRPSKDAAYAVAIVTAGIALLASCLTFTNLTTKHCAILLYLHFHRQ